MLVIFVVVVVVRWEGVYIFILSWWSTVEGGRFFVGMDGRWFGCIYDIYL